MTEYPADPAAVTAAQRQLRHAQRIRPISIGTATANRQLYTPQGTLFGWSIRESTGTTAATATLWDGVDASGVIVGVIGLAGGGLSHPPFPEKGVELEAGLWLQVESGSLKGVVYVRGPG